MKKHLLIIGIILLFIFSTVTPLTFGTNINNFKEQSTYDRDLLQDYFGCYNLEEIPESIRPVIAEEEDNRDIPRIENVVKFEDPPEEEWNKTFGGVDNDWGVSVSQTNDGGFIQIGTTVSFGAGMEDIWLIKTDKDGNKQWDKTFGGVNDDRGESVLQTNDGGYIITGLTTSYDAGDLDLWLIKTDEYGNKKWDKTYGGTGWDYGFEVQKTRDDGYIIIGFTTSYGAGDFDFWLIKTDSNGNMQWNKTFGGAGLDWGVDVQQTSDYGYVITGFTTSFGAGLEDIWLIKTDADGNKQWDKTFGGVEYERGYCVQQTSDGGYIITGYTESYGPGNFDVWLIKTDADGNLQWDKTYGDQPLEFGNSVLQTNDNGYIICGVDATYITKHDVLLIKTDETGNLQWSKTYGGLDSDEGKSIQLTSDGGYIITGYTHSFGAGEFDFWLIKLKGDNQPPNKPDAPWKKTISTKSYTFCTKTNDPDGDQVWFWWDWDDGTTSDWLGPYNSGEVACESHIWDAEGIYTIRVKAKDFYGAESEWTELEVNVSRNRVLTNGLFVRFLEQFPNLQKILIFLTI